MKGSAPKVKGLVPREILAAGIFAVSLLAASSLGGLAFRFLPPLPVLANPHGIVSPLVDLDFAPQNNILRYFLYLACGPLCWLAWWPLTRRCLPLAWGQEPARKDNGAAGKILWWATVALVALHGCLGAGRFFQLDPQKINSFWFFHEGEWLEPAWIWRSTGKLWTGAFFAHGAVYDALAAAFSWHWLGADSIGASRVGVSFLSSILFPANAVFLLVISHYSFLSTRNNHRAASFCALALLLVYTSTLGTWQHWDRRDFPVLLGLTFFYVGLVREKKLLVGIAGLWALLAFFYSIDRGIYFTLGALAVSAVLGVSTRDWRRAGQEMTAFLVGWALGLLLLLAWLGGAEIAAAASTSLFHFQIKDLSDGNPYPPPGFPITNWKFLRTTHTFPLVCQTVQVLALFSLARQNRWRFRRDSQWIAQILFLVFSLVYYRSALSRGDELHYRYSATFSFLGAAYCATLWAARTECWRTRGMIPGLLALCAFPCAMSAYRDGTAIGPGYRSFRQNMGAYVQRGDDSFLLPWQAEVANLLREEFRQEKCFFSLASEPLWPFLLRKPSCGRFYLTWLVSDERLQRLAIEELRQTMPGKILAHTPLSGDKMDGVPIERRARLLYRFVEENYEPYREFKGWEIWARRQPGRPRP